MSRPAVALCALLLAGCALAPAAPTRPLDAPPAGEAERARLPPLGPPPALEIPPVQRFALATGLPVRLVEVHRLPIVALHLVVEAGAVHDPADRPGLAAFTAAMLTEGTGSRSATELSDALAAEGASLGASAGFDSAQLAGAALSGHLPGLLALFADVLTAPAFAAADFARVQDQRLVTLAQQRDQPGAQAGRALAPLFWGDHPYGHSALGSEESLRAMGRDELVAFHARRWRPGAAELVVVGDVTRAALEPMLATALAGWTGPAAPPPPSPRADRPPARTVLLARPGAPQTFLLLAAPGQARASPELPAAEVAFQILGGGTASRLFRHLREEKGYTYGLSARPEARKLGGMAVVGGSVKAEVTGPALAALLGELAALRDRPASPEELSTARQGIVLGLPSEFAGVGAIAGKLAEAVVHGLPEDHWPRYAAAVSAVDAGAAGRAARAWLDPSRLTLVLVGDPQVVAPQLAGLGLAPLEVRPASLPAAGAVRPVR